MSDQPPSVLAAALDYARLQWSVIPIRPRDKRPVTRWREFQHRLATEQEIDAWYQRWPTANVAVVTGEISGVVVLDIDPRHGGSDSLAQWEAEHGPLPLSVEARSGGGGRHIYFRHPGDIVHNRVGIAPGIDLRGDGGCIVAPPSIHSSGNAYAWVSGQEPGQVNLAEMPAWMLQLVRDDSKHE